MKKVMPIKINWINVESQEGELHLQSAFNIIFSLARQNLLVNKSKNEVLTDKYNKVT